MKIWMLLSLLAFGMLVLSGIINRATAKTETQKYRTLYREGDFEIRFYPEAVLASVTMNGSYDNSRNNGFRILAGYIFGGNKKQQKIAMTSPVRMSSNEGISTMSFVLPSAMELEKLPEPENNRIVLHRSQPVYVAVVEYGGYTSDREIEQKKDKLLALIHSLGLKHNSRFEYLGYNPPYQLVNRKNEVMVELVNFEPEDFNLLKADRPAGF